MPGLRRTVTAPAVEIEDPVEGARYALDSAANIAHRIKVPVRQTKEGVERTQLHPAPGPNQSRIHIEKMGIKEIAGIRTEGTRTVITWPAGAVGNDKPRVITSEKWLATELHLVILWRSSDAESSINESLSELERKEPDANLFKIPSGYQIVDDDAVVAARRNLPLR